MQVNSETDFAKWIGDALLSIVTDTADEYVFSPKSDLRVISLSLSKSILVNTLTSLGSFEASDETALHDTTSYEVLLRDESVFPRRRMSLRGETLTISDTENGLEYTLAPPSDVYMLYLLMSTANIAKSEMLWLSALTRIWSEADEKTSVFDVLRRLFVGFVNLRIVSLRSRNSADFKKFATSFLFHLSYNIDVALVPQRQFKESLRSGRISALRRPRLRELDPPRREFVADLVYHYQLGVAADNPSLQFLSYYHIAEHFFEDVFNDDLIERIRQKITQPDFSYKRKKDVGLLIRDISKSLQIRNERITYSEQEALRLTLNKYVDLGNLLTELRKYDAELIPYYASTPVTFAGADVLNLESTDLLDLHKKLATRIYKVRNAIVHSKESEKARFMPFHDDRTLYPEIPLLRFIGEQIIIATSSIL